jgi:hypothetical protein
MIDLRWFEVADLTNIERNLDTLWAVLAGWVGRDGSLPSVSAALHAEVPPAHAAVGDGINDLLALASQPADVRDAALGQLLTTAAKQPQAT